MESITKGEADVLQVVQTFSRELEGHGSTIPCLLYFHYKAKFQSTAGKTKVQQISIAEHLNLVTGAQVNFC